MLELAVSSAFEYICLINTKVGLYSLHGNDTNSHALQPQGSFDDATRTIRDTLIAPEQRDAYYEKARLSTVVAHMNDGNDTYSYRYTLPNGERQATFHWFEPTHTQLLVTVQLCRDAYSQ